MILPTIALLTGAAFDNLPHEYVRASAALGLSRERTIFSLSVGFSEWIGKGRFDG